MVESSDWIDLERELRGVLLDGVAIGGTIEEADIRARIGGRMHGLTIELSDLEGDAQGQAYLVLCDLLATRRASGVEYAAGCMVFVAPLSPDALAAGLVGMARRPGEVTPILPLSRPQAAALSTACQAGSAFLDDALQLVQTAARSTGIDVAVAATLLSQIDEMVERRTGPSQFGGDSDERIIVRPPG